MNGEWDDRQAEFEWLAFRYAAGELPADEARAVEQQMAHDQTMREAVSRAVALGLKLAAARPRVTKVVAVDGILSLRSHRLRLHRLAWASAGIAASIALAVGAYLWRGSDGGIGARPERMVNVESSESAVEATAWLELRTVGDSTAQLERRFAEWEPNELSDSGTNPSPIVPRWLVELAMTGDGKVKHD